MHIRVSKWRSIKNQRVVEQRAITVGHLLQLVQEVRNQTDMVFVDRGELRDSLLILSVVRSPVEPDSNATFREGSSRGIATQLKRRHASNVTGEGEHL